jgi:DNA (cytosine-5)-methyltransferase 1
MKTLISLFCGVGGLDLPFVNKGFKVLFANDFNQDAIKIYNQNFNDSATFADITKFNIRNVPKSTGLLAGFPCQAFSIAGKRMGFNDARGTLFFDVLKILKQNMPDFFLLENVKGLMNHDNGRTITVILNSLKDLGYHVKHTVLNAMYYGDTPQCRERVYIVGFKNITNFNKFEFPAKIDLKTKLSDVIDFNKKVDDKYYYTKAKYPKAFKLIEEAHLKQNTIYQIRRVKIRENKSGVCPTLTANMGTGGHNVPIILTKYGYRKLTPKECFNVQGFPKTFKIDGISQASAYTRAGNSVCVKVVDRIAKNIAKALA